MTSNIVYIRACLLYFQLFSHLTHFYVTWYELYDTTELYVCYQRLSFSFSYNQ